MAWCVSVSRSATSLASLATRCCCGRSARSPRTPPWVVSQTKGKRSAAMAISAMPPRAGMSSAALTARVEAGPQGADSRFIVTNLRGLPKTLYEKVWLRARTGREPDQGAQAAPRLGPHLLPQGDRQPVPPVDPHRRLLADAEPARSGSLRPPSGAMPNGYHPPLPDQGRRARHRDGHPHQDRLAERLSLSGRLYRSRRPHRQPPP